MDLSLKLSRPSRTFSPGETVDGFVTLTPLDNNTRVQSLKMGLNGLIMASSGSSLQLFDEMEQILLNEDNNLDNLEATNINFDLKLPSKSSKALMDLPETYHGVKLSIRYTLRAELSVLIKSGIMTSFKMPRLISKDIEIEVVTTPRLSSRSAEMLTPHEFKLTPDLVKRSSGSSTVELPDFEILGRVERTMCVMSEPLIGGVCVSHSSKPIKSIEAQLLRVETVRPNLLLNNDHLNFLRGVSEIQSLQVASGDCKSVWLPIFVMLPRKFVCASANNELFGVNFELNVLIIFDDDLVVAENVPITVFRHADDSE